MDEGTQATVPTSTVPETRRESPGLYCAPCSRAEVNELNELRTMAERIAGAFCAAGLSDILYPASSVRDDRAIRFTVELGYGFTAADAERAQGAIAGYLGVPAEHLTISPSDDWHDRRAELVIYDTVAER